jgi:chromosome partitioning protein
LEVETLAGSTIAICSWKGGCGKTTLCTALAVNLAAARYRVAVIDADPNQAFITWHKIAEAPPLTVTSCIDHNEIVSHAAAQAETHDVTLIDTAGFANQTAVFAIGAADLVLIPAMPDRNSVLEARKTARQVDSVSQIARRSIPYRVVLSRWDPRGLSERAAIEDIEGSSLPRLAWHLSDLSAYQKYTFSGSMPHTGIVAVQARRIIDEIVALGAISSKPIAAEAVA